MRSKARLGSLLTRGRVTAGHEIESEAGFIVDEGQGYGGS